MSSNNDFNFDINHLKTLFESQLRDSRIEAIQEIVEKKIEEAIPLLQKVITNDPDPLIRELAIIGISSFEDFDNFSILSEVTKSHKERNGFVRARAVWASRNINSLYLFDFLVNLLQDEFEDVIYWAIINLVNKFPEKIPMEKLLNIMMKNKSDLIRQTIAWGFGILKFNKANKFLIDVLIKDKTPSVRLNAAWALGRINDLASSSALCFALKNELNPLVKREIVLSLGILLEKSKSLSIEQNNKLFSIENQISEAITTLSIILQRDSIYFVRRACAQALGEICNPKSLDILINIFSSEINQFVRREIATALGKIGDPQAIPILKKSLRSHYKIVVNAAEEAISKIKNQ